MWQLTEDKYFSFIFFKDGTYLRKFSAASSTEVKELEVKGKYKFIDEGLIRLEDDEGQITPNFVNKRTFRIVIYKDKIIISSVKPYTEREPEVTLMFKRVK